MKNNKPKGMKRTIEKDREVKSKRQGNYRISLEEKRAFYTRQIEIEEFYVLMGAMIMTEIKKRDFRIYEVADMIGVSYDLFRKMFLTHTAVIPAHLIYRLSLLFNIPYYEFFRFVPFKARPAMRHEEVTANVGSAIFGIKGWGDEQIKILKLHDEKTKQSIQEENWGADENGVDSGGQGDSTQG